MKEIKYVVLIVFTIVVTFRTIVGTCCENLDMVAIFKKYGVIPEVLPQYSKNMSVVCVTYKGDVEVQGGNYISPADTVHMPEFYWKANPKKLYTLVMLDPDALSREKNIISEFRHLLIWNIHGNTVASGEDVSPYFSPIPPPATGTHRYVFLVYQQRYKLEENEATKLFFSLNRTNWSVAKFAKDNKLGQPLFGNLFVSKFVTPLIDLPDIDSVV